MKEGLTRIQGRNKNLIDLYPEGGMNINSDNSYILVNLENSPIYTAPSSNSEFIVPNLSATGSLNPTGAKDIVPQAISGSSIIINESYPQGISTQFFLSTQFLPDDEDINLASPTLPPNISIGERGLLSETVFQRPTTTTGGTTGAPSGFTIRTEFPSRSEVKQIILHTTAGNPNTTAQYTVDMLQSTYQSDAIIRANPASAYWAKYIGIHWSVDQKGNTAKGVDELKRSVHADSWNEFGIGIEVVGIYNVSPQGSSSRYVTADGYTPAFEAPNVANLGFKFGRWAYNRTTRTWYTTTPQQYLAEFTDVQIASLKKLIEEILGRYPKIKNGVKGNVWEQVFKIPKKDLDPKTGRPKPGSTIYVTPDIKNNWALYNKYFKESYGIFSHSTGDGDHTDIQPTPKIIKMLLELGYDEIYRP